MNNIFNQTVLVNNEPITLSVEYSIKKPKQKISYEYPFYGDWQFKTNGEIELSSMDYVKYLELWNCAFEKILSPIKVPQNILIIGGGDLQIGNFIKCMYSEDFNIDIVDPLIYDIQVMLSGFLPHIYNINNFNCYDQLFDNFYHDEKNIGKYNIICVDVSDDYLDIANSFYTHDLSNKLSELLEDDGYIIAYMANGSLGLNSKFKIINTYESIIETYSELPTKVCVFKKVLDEDTERVSVDI